MKSLKAVVLTAAALSLTIALLGCGGSPPSGPIVIRLGHIGFPESPFDKGCRKFKELLEERTAGQVEVRIFGSAQLGEDKEMLEGLRLGTLEMHVPSSVLHSVEPMFGLFDLPFLIEDREQMERIAEGPVGEKLTAKLVEHGLVLLGFWENGFRMITNNVRPIVTPADLKGIKLRTPKDPERVKLFRAFGANPTSMSFGEVFSALKQGVIDGQENPLSQIVPARFYEVQRYLSISRHVYSPAYPLMSQSYFNSLPKPIRQAVKEVAVEVGRYHRRLGVEEDQRHLELLKDKLEIHTIDRQAFEALAGPLYDDHVEHFGSDLLEAARGERHAP
ncbi:MAG: TRAP transporter substrate-binding protein [Acidobacteriota bacterium]